MKGGLKEKKKENIKHNQVVKQIEKPKINNINRQSYIEFTKELQHKYSNFLNIISESEALNILEREYKNKFQSRQPTNTDYNRENLNNIQNPVTNQNIQRNNNPSYTNNCSNKPFNLFRKDN
jgi:hypothetical protein